MLVITVEKKGDTASSDNFVFQQLIR